MVPNIKKFGNYYQVNKGILGKKTHEKFQIKKVDKLARTGKAAPDIRFRWYYLGKLSL